MQFLSKNLYLFVAHCLDVRLLCLVVHIRLLLLGHFLLGLRLLLLHLVDQLELPLLLPVSRTSLWLRVFFCDFSAGGAIVDDCF